MATLDIKYLCNPTDGTPGPPFDAFEVDAMNAASKGDKRGYLVADCWLGIDEGGTDPTAPALPPGASATVRVPIDWFDLAMYDGDMVLRLMPGQYTLSVGGSSTADAGRVNITL